MKKLVFSDKIKTAFFVGFLIIFAFFLFNQNVSAETYYSEDFERFSVGDGQSVLKYDSNFYYSNTLWENGFIVDNWASSPTKSFALNSDPTIIASSILSSGIYQGSLFTTFKLAPNTQTSNWLRLQVGLPTTYNYVGVKFYLSEAEGLLKIRGYNGVTMATYPIQSNGVYSFRLDFSFYTRKLSLYINNVLILDEVNMSNDYLTGTANYINSIFIQIYPYSYPSADYYIDDIYLTDGSNPFTFNLPVCGSDDGLLLDDTPTNLCLTGTSSSPIFNGTRWDWECISGAVSEMCRAYASTDNPINGTCGVWDGLDFDIWPDTTELCGISSSLIVPSMLETIDSYTWTCAGFNGGTSDYCSANKTTAPIFPELPTGSLDDCSSLGIPEVWFCNISNTIKSIFLPSAEKITELNEVINQISGRFPFSYISSAENIISEIKNGITESDNLSMSIFGSENKTIDFVDIPFIKYIKIFSTILMTLLFIFWLRKFIVHIF